MITWQYIAGFFDGEGSLCHNGKGFRITIAQTNKNVLEQIKSFAGVGDVFEVTKRKAHWKDSWVYYIARQQDVLFFIKKIRRYTIIKSSLVKKNLPQIEKSVRNIFNKRNNRMILKNKAVKLRKAGYTYREIGKKLNKDFGYIRRVILQ